MNETDDFRPHIDVNRWTHGRTTVLEIHTHTFPSAIPVRRRMRIREWWRRFRLSADQRHLEDTFNRELERAMFWGER